ncbi:hypothetical protein P1X14_06590 [Sphingomonas sp. AOB5]|uniref:hypothetical protein n=1 Tax=Sphingomonas sp. AOB5 TaxID=3034017 RepID=UPI0023F8193D|nr:hypothetical protein [Sphingomonas sp. AOB5]MDF7774905.1 hypothetical protein [Sphingomonas sp. AOB5]
MFLAAIVALAQAAIFAPPLDVPIRVVTERIEPEGTYRAERLVRFHRDGAGYRAKVRVIAASAETSDQRSAMFDAGFSGIIGRTIEFRLDPTGNVVEVIDLAAHWKAFSDGIARLTANRNPTATAAAERIRTLPEAQQQAIFASLVTALISGDGGETPDTTRTLRLPAASPFGGSAMLDGTRRFERSGEILRSTTLAQGDVAGRDGATARVSVETVRDTDPRTGLIASARETTRTRLGEQTRERVSTLSVRIEPGTNWPD